MVTSWQRTANLAYCPNQCPEETQHHEDQAIVLDINAIFFELSATIEKSNASNCSKPSANAQILFGTL